MHNADPIAVDFLYWQTCPNYPEALARLRAIMAKEGLSNRVQVTLHDVTSDDEAQKLRFPGSATIRVAGRDIDPVGAEVAGVFAVTCRVYRTSEGRLSPLPPVEAIRTALQAARSPTNA